MNLKEVGKKIQNNNKVSNEYPQMFYYQNGKLIKYGHVYDEDTFSEYQKDLNLSNDT